MRLMDKIPPWLDLYRDLSHSKDPERLRRSIDYFLQMKQAQPRWLTKSQRQKFHAIYRKMRALRARGQNVNVDHIVPLRSDLVCGLHVWWNLEIIDAGANFRKGNRWWPGHPFENGELFKDKKPEPHQLRLFICPTSIQRENSLMN